MLTRCPRCDARVMMGRTPTGRALTCDADPSPDGVITTYGPMREHGDWSHVRGAASHVKRGDVPPAHRVHRCDAPSYEPMSELEARRLLQQRDWQTIYTSPPLPNPVRQAILAGEGVHYSAYVRMIRWAQALPQRDRDDRWYRDRVLLALDGDDHIVMHTPSRRMRYIVPDEIDAYAAYIMDGAIGAAHIKDQLVHADPYMTDILWRMLHDRLPLVPLWSGGWMPSLDLAMLHTARHAPVIGQTGGES